MSYLLTEYYYHAKPESITVYYIITKHTRFIEYPGYCHNFSMHREYDNKQDPLYNVMSPLI